MRCLVFLISVVFLASLVTSATRPADEPLDERQKFFATVTTGEVQGDELYDLQLEQLKTELHYIQLEVERYSVDYSISCEPAGTRYPQSMNQLVAETYSEYRDAMLAYARPGFYANPFTASGADDLNAVCVPFGWTEDAVGNYSYLLHLDDFGNVVGYMIVGYGNKLDSGFDIDGDGQLDGVVISLSSGPMSEKDNEVFYDNGRVVVDRKLSGETGVVVMNSAPDSPELIKAKEKKVKSGIHGVQLALERLQVYEEHYPQSMNLVVYPAWSEYHGKATPYLADDLFYPNPFDANKDSETNARCVPFGWTLNAPGNFSYLTQYDESGEVSAYALVGYGTVLEDGMDIDGDGDGDGIIIILWSGQEHGVEPIESGVYEYYNCGRIVKLPFTRPVH